MVELITKKCIISGDIIEIYDYELGYSIGHEAKNPLGRGSNTSQEVKEINREKVSYRAKQTVRRLINANVGRYGDEFTSKFLTLTFADHVTDVSEANYEFTKFIQRMNYEFFKSKKANIRYVTVIEFTKKKRIHYHVVLFNIPYLQADRIAEIWGNGFIKVNKIKHVDNVGAYVSKYMTKDNLDILSNKSYFTSRNLFKSDEITDKKRVENLANSLPSALISYESTFENDYVGTIHYKQYNITRAKTEENLAQVRSNDIIE